MRRYSGFGLCASTKSTTGMPQFSHTNKKWRLVFEISTHDLNVIALLARQRGQFIVCSTMLPLA